MLPWLDPVNPFSGEQRAEGAVSHGVERRNPSGQARGTWRGHLRYKLAVIKPLLTVMGSFQSEVMPAMADKRQRPPQPQRTAITEALPSVTGSSSHAHPKVHFPAQPGTLPRDKCLFAFNLLQAEEALRRHSITGEGKCLHSMLSPPPLQGTWAGPGCVGGGRVPVGAHSLGKVWGCPGGHMLPCVCMCMREPGQEGMPTSAACKGR